MPTPSNAPESEPLRPFTSCPDVDEQAQTPSQTIAQSSTRWAIRTPSPVHEVHDQNGMEIDSEEGAGAGSVARRARRLDDQRGGDAELFERGESEDTQPRQANVERTVSSSFESRRNSLDLINVDRSRESTEDAHKQATSEADVTQTGMEATRVPSEAGSRSSSATLGRTTSRAPERTASSTRQQFRSPLPVVGEAKDVDGWSLPTVGRIRMEDSGLMGMGSEYAHTRVVPMTPPSYLRPGSRFIGMQQSERQRYDVEVEIKHVDLRESFLCGYLRIQGLTDDHPTLTTYFEGEIIGSKYGFITRHPTWGANEKIDMAHWAKFEAFKPFQRSACQGQVVTIDFPEQETIFMRWKEHFLVPDHRVRTISGASFEGFYYICFNQVRGTVSGIYFHNKSEKFQLLELRHLRDKGCHGALEFR